MGMLCNPRLEGLLRQADEAGALLLGLQETRLRWSGTRTLGHHFIIQTASTQGHFGVALGISLKTCYGLASGVELFFKPADFSVIAEEPRLLLVKVDASHLRCLILVAHTPHSGHSDAELADWWRHLRTVIPAKYKSWDLLCLGDWNARLGSVMSQHVGSAGADVESVNGGWLHQFMADRSLWAPSTFEEVHSGLHGTWQHPRTLAWSRLDFVVLPSAWHCTASYVDDTYDAALGHLDHSAVSAEVNFAGGCIPSSGKVVHRPGPRLHLAPMSLATSLPLCLASCSPPPSQVDVHSHAAWLSSQLVALGSRCGSVLAAAPRRAGLTAGTWQLLLQKRYHRNTMMRAQRQLRLWLLRQIWRGWSSIVCSRATWLLEQQPCLKSFDFDFAFHWMHFRRTARLVCSALLR